MEIRLSRSARFTTAMCLYHDGEISRRGRAAVQNEKLTDPVRTDSLCQQIIKLAVYRAVLRAGHRKPVWGALTGVRPGKLMYPLLLSGLSEQEALRQFETDYDVSHERAQLCLDASRATMKADRLLRPKDICLYIGIPFCPTRCAYCSFVSQSTEKSLAMIPPFLEALSREIDAVAEQVRLAGLRVVSLYMGGGTPTTLTAAQLDGLLTKLETAFDLSGLRECTVEAGRPDTITAEKLAVLRRHGTDRVSVNPQTMSDAVLEAIGRRHSAEDIRKALRQVRETGGFAVNMDLIAGLPTDSVEGFSRTVDAVLELEPENITVHTLSIKRGARLHFGEESLPTDGEVKAMLDYAEAGLRAKGYSPYYLYRQKNMSGGFENTGWTKPGRENLYNICIMEELCSILALGAGGSTKLVRRDGGKNERFVAPKYPAEYIADIDRICRDKGKINRFYGTLHII
jgi:oxygen-independent coproporphyrinogen-3 oxidase